MSGPRRVTRRRRRTLQVVVTIFALIFVSSLAALWISNQTASSEYAPAAPVPPPQYAIREACLNYDDSVVVATGKVAVVDVRVDYFECARDTKLQGSSLSLGDLPGRGTPTLVARQAQVMDGGRASLKLVSPLFDGTIGPISDVDQPIEVDRSGTWSWEVRTNNPGDYPLSLVLSVLNKDGTQVELQNERQIIGVHSVGTKQGWLKDAWLGFIDLLGSLQTLVLSAIGLAAAYYGLRANIRKDRQETKAEEEIKPEKSSGYL